MRAWVRDWGWLLFAAAVFLAYIVWVTVAEPFAGGQL
jgi:hypothetical protein